MRYDKLNQKILNEIFKTDKTDERYKELTLLLFTINKKFVYKSLNEMSTMPSNIDDYLQLSYLALFKHVKSYENCNCRFLAFYRVWIFHYVYLYNTEMQLPFRVPVNFFKKVGYTRVPLESNTSMYCINILDDLMNKTLWDEVEVCVGEMNKDILKMYYKEEMSYAAIGRYYGIGRERVRQRVLRSIRKLRESKSMKLIYDAFFD